VGFEAQVEDINRAAGKLAGGDAPVLSAEGSPNVGETGRAGGYAGDYEVWLLTRKEDLTAAEEQVTSLVKSIHQAAASYHATDSAARDTFLKSLDRGFERIDR
jgi:hypothetical protein